MNWDQIETNWTEMSRRLRPVPSATRGYGVAPRLESKPPADIIRDGSDMSPAEAFADQRQTG